MNILQGILLGILQGIAEFLPISSSGHLALAQYFFGLSDIPLLFDVFLHLATLCAVVLFFRRKIWSLLCTFCAVITKKNTDPNDRQYIIAIILATFVTGLLGIIVEKFLDNLPLWYVCTGFLFTSFLLIFSSLIEKHSNTLRNTENCNQKTAPSNIQALLIGVAQGIGTIAGISRSGSTISGALLCGVTRDIAGEFSFIVSIPAILGAFLLEVKDLKEVSSSIGAVPVIAGCAAAFASGFLSLALFMKIIRKGKLEWFACYLIPVGILGLIFLH